MAQANARPHEGQGAARRRSFFGDMACRPWSQAGSTQRQIEAARRALVRYMKRRGKVWIRIFPDKP